MQKLSKCVDLKYDNINNMGALRGCLRIKFRRFLKHEWYNH